MESVIPILISGMSLTFAIFTGVIAIRRNNKHDDQDETNKMTTVIVKLENIENSLTALRTEMRAEIRDIKESARNDHDCIIKMDQSVKSLWKQLEELKLHTGFNAKAGYAKDDNQ